MKQKFNLIFDGMSIDRMAASAIHLQIYQFIQVSIATGRLPIGSRLPSTRALAEMLKVSRNSVVLAYEQLTLEGHLDSRAGSGTRVSRATLESSHTQLLDIGASFGELSRRGVIVSEQAKPSRRPKGINLYPGLPASSDFPFARWAKIVAKYARSRSPELLSYANYGGLPRLRKAIAEHIAVARGVNCSPAQVIVTTGAQAGLDLLVRMLLDDGDQVWMEEPGYTGARGAFLAGGARLHPVRVSEAGWHFPGKDTASPKLIYVTPTCQWPTGQEMSEDQKRQLLRISDETNCWIIEDDYDGEYRLRGRQTPSLQGVRASDRAIYLGTFGKTIYSSLRIGFVVVPASLIGPLEQAIQVTGQFAPLVLQAALAEFIELGHFAGHLRRMRTYYATRLNRFIDICNVNLSEWVSLVPGESGIQVLAKFKKPIDDKFISAMASSAGVDLLPLSINYFFDQPQHGILFGYAQASDLEMSKAIAILKQIFATSSRDI